MSVTLYNLTLRFGKKQAEQPSVICWGKKMEWKLQPSLTESCCELFIASFMEVEYSLRSRSIVFLNLMVIAGW